MSENADPTKRPRDLRFPPPAVPQPSAPV